jgi:hypothetical protein
LTSGEGLFAALKGLSPNFGKVARNQPDYVDAIRC